MSRRTIHEINVGRVVVVATGVTPHCQPEQMPPLLGCLDKRRGWRRPVASRTEEIMRIRIQDDFMED